VAVSGVTAGHRVVLGVGFSSHHRQAHPRHQAPTSIDASTLSTTATFRSVVPTPWFVPDEVSAAPDAAVTRLADRLGVSVSELRGYGQRAQTRTDHLREIVRYLRWRSVGGPPGWKEFDEFLFIRAMEHDSPKLLFGLACEFLISERVVRPGVVHLLEHVATARERADRETWISLAHLAAEPGRRAELDALLVVGAALGRTPLATPVTGFTPGRHQPWSGTKTLDIPRDVRKVKTAAVTTQVGLMLLMLQSRREPGTRRGFVPLRACQCPVLDCGWSTAWCASPLASKGLRRPPGVVVCGRGCVRGRAGGGCSGRTDRSRR